MLLAAFDPALDLLLPRSCASCERPMAARDEGVICSTCWARLPLLPHPQCGRCGHPTAGRRCRFCELLPAYIRAVRSVCWVPHEVSSGVIHALKYHEWQNAAAGIGARMARLNWPPDVTAERAALVPIPLAPVRRRERGFNQAELIADVLAGHWGIPVWNHLLVRNRATGTQTRLTPGERSANVHRAFSVCDGVQESLRGRHLVLVDDVITTGATLNECAAALFDAGTRTVSYVTFGRARASGDK